VIGIELRMYYQYVNLILLPISSKKWKAPISK